MVCVTDLNLFLISTAIVYGEVFALKPKPTEDGFLVSTSTGVYVVKGDDLLTSHEASDILKTEKEPVEGFSKDRFIGILIFPVK